MSSKFHTRQRYSLQITSKFLELARAVHNKWENRQLNYGIKNTIWEINMWQSHIYPKLLHDIFQLQHSIQSSISLNVLWGLGPYVLYRLIRHHASMKCMWTPLTHAHPNKLVQPLVTHYFCKLGHWHCQRLASSIYHFDPQTGKPLWTAVISVYSLLSSML